MKDEHGEIRTTLGAFVYMVLGVIFMVLYIPYTILRFILTTINKFLLWVYDKVYTPTEEEPE